MSRLSVSKSAITKVQMAALIVVIVVVVIAGVGYWWMTRPPAVGIIKIGYTAPFTGPAAEFGTNGWYGMEIALDEINEKGIKIGETVYTIEIIKYDDRCEPKEGAANVHRLIVEDKVVGILGSHCSSVCMATVPIIQENKIPTITIECAADAVTRQGATYYFRMRPSMPLMAPSISKVMVEKLGVKSVAFLAIDDDYGRSFVDSFKTELEKVYGVPTVAEHYFERGTTDYIAYLTGIKAAEPDSVMYIGVCPEGAMIMKQATELGLTEYIKFIGAEEMAGMELVELAGKEGVEGTYAISLVIYPPDPTASPGLVKLDEEMRERYGMPLHYASVFAYDALYVMSMAIENAQSLDPAKIGDALDVLEWDGLEGYIKFEDFEGYTNQGRFPVHIFMWTDGTRSYVG